jgi:hypothetical protein
VDHLVFVVHGIGAACDIKFRLVLYSTLVYACGVCVILVPSTGIHVNSFAVFRLRKSGCESGSGSTFFHITRVYLCACWLFGYRYRYMATAPLE